jgi:glutamyl-tRNA synthetase
VALLGCSYEEGKDLYTIEELSRRFRLDKLNKAPAVFDYKKLEWYNGQYIRTKSDGELAALALPFAVEQGLFGPGASGPDAAQRARFTGAMGLIRERVNFPGEIPAKLGYLFSEPAVPDAEEFIPKKSSLPETIRLLRLCRELIPSLTDANDAEAEALVKAKAEAENVKLGDLLMPLRVAITGARVSPPLFGSLRLLGTRRSTERIDRALAALRLR